jgi:hypothetical protein
MYVAIPGRYWERLIAKLSEISKANCDMQDFYRGHQANFVGV